MTTICHIWGNALAKPFCFKLCSVLFFLHALRVSYAEKKLIIYCFSLCRSMQKSDPVKYLASRLWHWSK